MRGNLERYDELENRKVKYVEIKTEFQKAQNKVKELEQNRETCKRELEELFRLIGVTVCLRQRV